MLASVQRAREGTLMAERFGPMECAFRLRPVEGGLTYEQVGAWFCLGPLAPADASPVRASRRVHRQGGSRGHGGDGDALARRLAGWLLIYEGLIQPGEEAP